MNIIDNARAVGSLPKCIRKNPTRRTQKNLQNIIWYRSYESSKTGKYNTFLVSFIITHGHNDFCLVSLCAARYFRRLLIKPRQERRGLTRHRFLQRQALENLFLLVSCLYPNAMLTQENACAGVFLLIKVGCPKPPIY